MEWLTEDSKDVEEALEDEALEDTEAEVEKEDSQESQQPASEEPSPEYEGVDTSEEIPEKDVEKYGI